MSLEISLGRNPLPISRSPLRAVEVQWDLKVFPPSYGRIGFAILSLQRAIVIARS